MNNKLTLALTEIQSDCVGLFKHPMSSVVELVIEMDDVGFTTITIGNLLGLQTSHFGNEYLKHVTMFPDNRTLAGMMNEPWYFSGWYNERFK